MSKMNREQIVKALECCSVYENCDGCPHFGGVTEDYCRYKTMVNALALIRELTKENEGLTELLDARCDRCKERERADTVRKMQKRLKGSLMRFKNEAFMAIVDVCIDNVAKEMLEEDT